MTPQARVQAAIELLDEVIVAARDDGAAADTLIARYFKVRRYAGSKDRRAVRDLVYAAIRRCGDRPGTGRAAMLGLAQDRPDLAEMFDGGNHSPDPIVAGEPVAEAGIVPGWLKSCLAEPVQDANEMAELLGRAPLDLRVNRLKGNAEVAHAAFPAAVKIDALPDLLRLGEDRNVEQTQAYREGLVEIQDMGSQIIVKSCEAKPGMTVIDLCAGAGGKTLGLAADMAGQGVLIAADTNRDRLSRLPERARRAGVEAVRTLLLDPGKELQAFAEYDGKADVVLVDAPCSGTGTWRRNPEARWRLTPERLDRLVREQARILDFAAPLVRPGGRLVYAVCALTVEEGKGQAEAFLSRHSGWESGALDHLPGRKFGPGRLLTPAHDGTDGFYIAAFLRS